MTKEPVVLGVVRNGLPACNVRKVPGSMFECPPATGFPGLDSAGRGDSALVTEKIPANLVSDLAAACGGYDCIRRRSGEICFFEVFKAFTSSRVSCYVVLNPTLCDEVVYSSLRAELTEDAIAKDRIKSLVAVRHKATAFGRLVPPESSGFAETAAVDTM